MYYWLLIWDQTIGINDEVLLAHLALVNLDAIRQISEFGDSGGSLNYFIGFEVQKGCYLLGNFLGFKIIIFEEKTIRI